MTIMARKGEPQIRAHFQGFFFRDFPVQSPDPKYKSVKMGSNLWLNSSSPIGRPVCGSIGDLPRAAASAVVARRGLRHGDGVKRVVILLLCAWVAGCSSGPRSGSGEAARFRVASHRYVTEHFAARPVAGVGLGMHGLDGAFVVPTRANIDAEIRRLHAAAATFASFDPKSLAGDDRLRLALLQSVIDREAWALESQRDWRRNPMSYAGALDVSVYLKRDFKPLRARVSDMASILANAPAVFAAARANLDPVLPRPYVETAIEVAQGTASFLEKDVARAAQDCGDPAGLGRFEAAMKSAVAELRSYVAWLRAERLPSADDAFALGRDSFAVMLRSECIAESPERILELGMAELKAEQGRFDAAAREIDPTRPAAEVFKSIQRDHPTADNLLPETRRGLEAIRKFVVDRGLVTVPSEVRARVEETLPPFRATSFASMDTPGPFESKATEAYYYVTPVEREWPQAQADEWLSAFNYYTTDVVSIHEAYPGHYVQFLALNASKAGEVEKVFASYSFAEGWAHYCEEMVVGAGFGQPPGVAAATAEEKLRGAKYRIAQSDEALLRICRLCCAIRLHCQDMTLDEATRFFRDNCHYEAKPARSEALRGTFDPGYLFYTVGKMQIRKLRRDVETREGAGFSAKAFHDGLLSHGAPPLRLLREQLLDDPMLWPASL